ncbi:siderophore ABC transporter substrate-binding protein [Paraclostridium sordellii]|uniref:siderophore ABC transporter substrate-binding protein n=1 Tax=Paraclostridium sordellii TaxID=1505 RepID=UPI0005E263A3|nr:ABC transporter substrate-binding protein [Paeniclostridium sordellii]CEN84984.1 ABC transporter iron-family extracellular substrate-binding protein [[Clostridium] sordellii] [Paeniclostridium sordellii]
MNKKVAVVAGLVIAGLVGSVLFFGNKGNEKSVANKNDIVSVKHALGTTDVHKKPEKVVVFDYAALDAIETLGVDGVIGTAKGSSIPGYLSKYSGENYANVGGLKEPDLEKINSLNPDLIIINGRQHSFYDKLNKIAPTISLAKEDGKYMQSFTHNMEVIGEIFDKKKEVDTELVKINEKIDAINKKVKEKNYSATTLMASDGNLSVFGKYSRFGVIYNNLGFKNTDDNIENANHGQDVSFEYLASQNPDYMFVIDKSVISADKNQKPAKEILNNDLINNMKVAKDNKIVYLDTYSWYLSDGGIMSTNTMLDEINKAINK